MNKKLMAALFSLSMIMAAAPVQVKAEEEIPEEPEVMETTVEPATEVQAETMIQEEPVQEVQVTDVVEPICICEEACTNEYHNPDCPVCSQEGASLEKCGKYIALDNTILPQLGTEEETVKNPQQISGLVEESESEKKEIQEVEEEKENSDEPVNPELSEQGKTEEESEESEEVELEAENETEEEPAAQMMKSSALSLAPMMIQRAPGAVTELTQDAMSQYYFSSVKGYVLSNGRYRLGGNISLNSFIFVNDETELDLNGNTLAVTAVTGSVNDSGIFVNGGGKLTIKATGGGSIIVNGSAKASICVSRDGALWLKGGTIDGILLKPNSIFYADGGTVNGNVITDGGVTPFPRIQRSNDATGYTTFNGTIDRNARIDDSAKLTVTFKNEDKDFSTKRVLKGKTVSKPKNDPVKEGYYFIGWYKANLPYDFNDPVMDNITLTAKWPYKISFDTNGAGDISPYYRNNGEPIGELPVPAREGYIFDGWYTILGNQVNVTEKVNVSSTYYAHWKCDVNNLNVVVNDQTYTGSEIIPEVTVKHGDIVLKRDTDYTVSFSGNRNAGTASVTITGKKSTNRRISTSYTGTVTKNFNILPKPVAVSGITAADKPYDGITDALLDTSKAVINGIIGNDELGVTASGTFDNANAGYQKKVNVAVALTGASARNYTISSDSQKETIASIAKSNPELSVGAVSAKVYSDDDFQLNATHKGDGAVSYSSDNTDVLTVNDDGLVHITGTGTVAITVSLAESANYTAASDTVTVTVNKADGKITIANAVINKQYGDTDFSVKPSDSTPGKIKYTADNETVTVDANGNVHINKAGTGVITVSMDATGKHNAVSETITVNADPKPVSIQWNNDDSFQYDGTQHSISASIMNLLKGDTAVLTYSNNQAVDAGTYTTTITGISNPNYTLNGVGNLSHTWTIAKRNVILTSSGAHKMYDGVALTNHEITVSGAGFVQGQGADYVFSGSQAAPGESNNTFAYTLRNGTSEKNYNIITTYGKLSVGEAYSIIYTDGVENAEIFADQIYQKEKGNATPVFNGTPVRSGYQFIGWNPAFSDIVTGNVIYTASWKDITAPVITGIKDGGTYCTSQTITITDDSAVTVKVNDETVELTGNQFELTPEGTQVITVTDEAGNKTMATVHYGHTDLEHVEAVAATVQKAGSIEYWRCRKCNKFFSESNGTNEITQADAVINRLLPEMIDGHNQSVTVGDRTALTFRSNAAYEDFVKIEINGNEIDGKHYKTWIGSTYVKLHEDYISSLPVGTYTISIVSSNDLPALVSAQTTFTVKEKPAPVVTAINPQPEERIIVIQPAPVVINPSAPAVERNTYLPSNADEIRMANSTVPNTSDGDLFGWMLTMISAAAAAAGAMYVLRKK